MTLEGGFSDVEYDSGFEDDTTRWLVDLLYQMRESVALFGSYSQDFTLSATDGLRKTRAAAVGASYERESFNASTELFWDQSRYVRQDREDNAIGVRFDLSKPLARNLTANFNAEYEHARFDENNVKEDVDRVTLGTSLDYVYRRLTASLGYRYRVNESDIDTNDYTNNIVSLSGTVRF